MNTMSLGADYRDRFRVMITERSGIRLPSNKVHLLDVRLRRRSDELGKESVDEYLKWALRSENLEVEMPIILNMMTTNKTDFFRENAHFDFVTRTVLPVHPKGRPFRFWSAACSSGEEAYTMAMLLEEHAQAVSGFSYQILGTDLSATVVKKAVQGIYAPATVDNVPAELREKYFVKGTSQAGRPLMRVRDGLREKTQFAQMNLMDARYAPARNFDVIFLRNVLIYFDNDVQVKVISKIVDHLRPGGFFFVGHTETMNVRDPRLTHCATGVYSKGA